MDYTEQNTKPFPWECWMLEGVQTQLDVPARRHRMVLEISKPVFDMDDKDAEELIAWMREFIRMGPDFSFELDHHIKTHGERIRLIRERNEWKAKYEELKSHVDFMKELYGGGKVKG